MLAMPAMLGFLRQYAVNLLVALDHLGNALLLGDANETLSARFGRARNAGSARACLVCRVLTRVLGGDAADPDHCAMALDDALPSMARELWDWDRNRLTLPGTNVVRLVHLDREAAREVSKS